MTEPVADGDWGRKFLQDFVGTLLLLMLVLMVARSKLGLLALYLAGFVVGFTSPNGAVFGMFWVSILLVLNPAFLPADGTNFVTITRWFCFIPALFHLLARRKVWCKDNTVFAIVFVAYFFTAAVSSYALLASVAKIISFVGAMFLTLRLIELSDLELVGRKLAALISVIGVSGIPTLFIPAIGFNRNGTGFQGLLSHPQAYAIFAAVATPYLVYYAIKQKSRLIALIAGLMFLSIVPTESRTGVFSIILGTVLSLLPFGGQIFDPRKRRVLAVAICPLICGLALALPDSAIHSTAQFLRKRRSVNSDLADAVVLSRVGLFEKSIAGFKSEPLTGIGFGLPSSRLQYQQKSANLNSLSLSTEKGVLYTGILEETGLVGGAIFIYLLHWVLTPIIKKRALSALNVLLIFLILNFGEAVFFSFGYIGFWCWLVVGVERARCQIRGEARP